MFPAIWFIFSRRDCDLAAQHLEMHRVTLTTPQGALPGALRLH
jgi:superfamily II RNA helicase